MSRTAWVWTDDRREAVQQSVMPGRTEADIANEHGIKRRALSDAIFRGIIFRAPVYRRREEDRVVPFIPRDCNCCGKRFNAETRFIIRCEPCREKGTAIGDWSMGVV